MYRNPYCYGNEHGAHPPLSGNENCAIEQCCPHEANRDNLHSQRNGLVLPEVLYVGSQVPVLHQPVIKSFGTAHIECRSQKQERRRWQNRQEYAKNTECK